MSENAQTAPIAKSKEDIYDEQISPLMHQIIQIAQKHEIAMVASFHTPNRHDPDMVCTTGIVNPAWGTPNTFMGALKLLKDGYFGFALAERPDGSKEVHVMPMDM